VPWKNLLLARSPTAPIFNHPPCATTKVLMPVPKRVSGRRRYDERTVQMLKVVQLAQNAGFTIAEIQTLLHGFAPDTPPAARWQPLARQKLLELDALIERVQQMKRVLEKGLNCGCLRLEDCAADRGKAHYP
jgi:MerR family redox-sensitive transcriptional activator SoxR